MIRPGRRGHRRRAIAGAIVGVLVAGVIIGISRISVNSYKPRIEAALSSATGRQVLIHGRLGLGLSLHPTITASDVTIANPPGANPPGFSRPDMARIGALDVRVALLPLLHHEISIDSLTLEKPDILLERSTQGQENWRLTPAPAQAAGAPSSSAPGAPARPYALSLSQLRIEDGRIAYHDGRTGHLTAIDVPRLNLSASGPDAPMKLDAFFVVNGLDVKAAGETGSLAALQNPATGKPWPVSLSLAAAGAKLTAQGGITRPMEAQGYDLTLNAAVPDLAALRPLAPNAKLPALHDIALAAHVADTGGPIPAISAINLRTGAGDLAPLLPGLAIKQASLSAPALDQPVKADLTGTLAGSPLSFAGTLGPVSKLLTGQPAGPFPIDIEAKSGASNFTAKGAIADPAHLAGMDLALSAATPDLAALSPLAGQPLPKLTDVGFSGQIRDAGGLTKGVAITRAKFISKQGDLAGDLSLAPGKPPAIKGKLTSNRLDLDAMRAALSLSQPAQPAAAAQANPSPPSAAHAPAPAPAAKSGHLIPDTPIPFSALHAANADVQLTVGTLIFQNETWRNLSAHLALDKGRLRLDPIKATLPAGTLDAAVTADATQAAPPVSLRLSAPAISVKSLLAALGRPAFASGTANLQAEVRGAGATPHAIASTLDGTISLTMAGGQIDTAALEKLLGPALARVNPAALLARGGSSEIRCFAARLSSRNGQATLDPFLLSSGLITVDGSGTVNLASETLDLHLHPRGRIGGTGFEVPLTLTGPLADPHAALNDTGVAAAGIQAVIGALAGKKLPGVALPPEPSCAAVLSQAHGGPAPAPARSPAPQALPQKLPLKLPQKLPDAGTLLKQLFH